MSRVLTIMDVHYLAKAWSPDLNKNLEATQLRVTSRERVTWRCSDCHYVFERSVLTQYRNQGQCPRCLQLKLNSGRSLQDLHPQWADCLVDDKNEGWLASHVSSFSHRQLWWHCQVCGEDYLMTVSQRVRTSCCPYCIGQRVSIKNSLAFLNPEASAQWCEDLNHGVSPFDVTANSNKEFWFRCQVCNHTWLASCNSRTYSRTNCPKCAKQKLSQRVQQQHLRPKSHHLGVTHPTLARQWHPTLNQDIPLVSILPKSQRYVWWYCDTCHHSWQAKVFSRTQTKKGKKCPACQTDPTSLKVLNTTSPLSD